VRENSESEKCESDRLTREVASCGLNAKRRYLRYACIIVQEQKRLKGARFAERTLYGGKKPGRGKKSGERETVRQNCVGGDSVKRSSSSHEKNGSSGNEKERAWIIKKDKRGHVRVSRPESERRDGCCSISSGKRDSDSLLLDKGEEGKGVSDNLAPLTRNARAKTMQGSDRRTENSGGNQEKQATRKMRSVSFN